MLGSPAGPHRWQATGITWFPLQPFQTIPPIALVGILSSGQRTCRGSPLLWPSFWGPCAWLPRTPRSPTRWGAGCEGVGRELWAAIGARVRGGGGRCRGLATVGRTCTGGGQCSLTGWQPKCIHQGMGWKQEAGDPWRYVAPQQALPAHPPSSDRPPPALSPPPLPSPPTSPLPRSFSTSRSTAPPRAAS